MTTIIGPGSLGILFAVKFWTRHYPVNLLDYKVERVKSISEKGISLIEKGRELKAFPRISTDPLEFGPQRYVLIFVKAYQTRDILEKLNALCNGDTLVVSLQNGLGIGEILAQVVPEKNIVLGTTVHGANRLAERRVLHAGTGPTIIGSYKVADNIDERLAAFSSLLSQAGFDCRVVRDIYPALWKKLLVNIGINPVTALTGIKNGAILRLPEITRIQEIVVREAYDIIRASGIDIGMDMDSLLDFVRGVCLKTSDNVSSMLQDRIKRGQTEIDFISGIILKKAKEIGTAAPANELLTRLVHFYSDIGWETDTDKNVKL